GPCSTVRPTSASLPGADDRRPCAPFFFFTHPPPTATYTLSLHDALPISFHSSRRRCAASKTCSRRGTWRHTQLSKPVNIVTRRRSEEHTSELQSLRHLVCRLLLEKKKLTHILCQHLTRPSITAQRTSPLL